MVVSRLSVAIPLAMQMVEKPVKVPISSTLEGCINWQRSCRKRPCTGPDIIRGFIS